MGKRLGSEGDFWGRVDFWSRNYEVSSSKTLVTRYLNQGLRLRDKLHVSPSEVEDSDFPSIKKGFDFAQPDSRTIKIAER